MNEFEEYRREKWKLLDFEDNEPPYIPIRIRATIEEVEDCYQKNTLYLINNFEELKRERVIQIPDKGSFGVHKLLNFPLTKKDISTLTLEEKLDTIFNRCSGWIYPDEDKFLTDIAISYSKTASCIVELGSYSGKSANLFAFILSDEEITINCIDKFDYPTHDIIKAPFNTLSGIHFDQFLKWTYWFRDKLNIIRYNTWKAPKFFDDNSVDIIFIDAGHDFDNCTRDILSWIPKLKRNGIMIGHDYCPEHQDVILAVNSIFGKNFDRGPGRIWYKIL